MQFLEQIHTGLTEIKYLMITDKNIKTSNIIALIRSFNRYNKLSTKQSIQQVHTLLAFVFPGLSNNYYKT